MSRVDALASHFRQYEYQQAIAFATRLKKPSTQREYELWNVAHDSMMENHDRQLRETRCFLTGIVNLGRCAMLRIFEIEEPPGGNRSIAHQFGREEGNAMNEETTLCVYNGHMRLLLPTTETTSGEWPNWRAQVNLVCEYEWAGWGTTQGKGESPPTLPTLEPCAVCGQNAKLPQLARFNPIGGGLKDDGVEQNGARRGEWNPRIYQEPTTQARQPMPFCNVGIHPPVYHGLGFLSKMGKMDLGLDFTPSCDHWWRIRGEIPEASVSYFQAPHRPISLNR